MSFLTIENLLIFSTWALFVLYCFFVKAQFQDALMEHRYTNRFLTGISFAFLGGIYIIPILFSVETEGLLLFVFFSSLTVCSFFYKGGFRKKIFVASFFCFHLIIFQGVIAWFFVFVNKMTIDQMFGSDIGPILLNFLTNLSSVIFLFVYNRLLDARIETRYPISSERITFAMSTLLILISLSFLINYNFYSGVHITNTTDGLYYGIINFAFCLLFYIVYKNAKDISYLEEYYTGFWDYKQQLEKQRDAFDRQKEYIITVRQFKHDYASLKRTMEQSANSEKDTSNLTILKQIDDSVKELDKKYSEYSNHDFVQSLLHSAAKQCNELGVSFKAEVPIPKSLNITDLDLSRIISNIIDNAIENVVKSEGVKMITINSYISEQWVTIACANSFDGKLKYKGDKIVTTKRDAKNHGMGITNVETVAKKNGGFAEFNREENIFIAKIHLPIDEV